MQLIRPKYFFPQKVPVDNHGKIGHLGQASAALEGLLIDADVCLIEQSATAPRGSGVLLEFIPNPIPTPYQTGMPKTGWAWFEFDAGNGNAGFIGWPEGEPIGPEHFARPESIMISGMEVTDPQEREWLVPVARQVNRLFGSLPTRWTASKSGLKEVASKSAEPIWEFSGEVFDYLRAINHCAIYESSLDKKWHDPYGIDAAIRVLGINHHFGYAELILLEGLGCNPLERDFAVECLQAFVGYQGLMDYREQKKTRDSSRVTNIEAPTEETPVSSNSSAGGSAWED